MDRHECCIGGLFAGKVPYDRGVGELSKDTGRLIFSDDINS